MFIKYVFFFVFHGWTEKWSFCVVLVFNSHEQPGDGLFYTPQRIHKVKFYTFNPVLPKKKFKLILLPPGPHSIYNFSETGADDLGKIAPLPAVGYYKEKIKQESRWMMKTHVANSPKWSWIISNHYERQNTYLRGRAILPRYKNYVVLKRLDVSAKEHGLEGAQELIKFLQFERGR